MALAFAQYEDLFQLVSGYLYGARGYVSFPTRMCVPCCVPTHVTPREGPHTPSDPNLLDEPLKGFIVNPADLPWTWVKRLATSGERVNHDSQ